MEPGIKSKWFETRSLALNHTVPVAVKRIPSFGCRRQPVAAREPLRPIREVGNYSSDLADLMGTMCQRTERRCSTSAWQDRNREGPYLLPRSILSSGTKTELWLCPQLNWILHLVAGDSREIKSQAPAWMCPGPSQKPDSKGRNRYPWM